MAAENSSAVVVLSGIRMNAAMTSARAA